MGRYTRADLIADVNRHKQNADRYWELYSQETAANATANLALRNQRRVNDELLETAAKLAGVHENYLDENRESFDARQFADDLTTEAKRRDDIAAENSMFERLYGPPECTCGEEGDFI